MAGSATFNTPPATQEDHWIVKAILLKSGLISADPSDGIHMSPARPQPYHYKTKGSGIIAGNVISIAIMLAATVTRLYLRWNTPHLKWGMDDILMVPALLLAVAYPACQIAMVAHGGAGQHIYDVTYHEYYVYHWLAAVAQIDFFVCVGLVKMSMAVFNMRITGMAVRRAWSIGNWTFFSIVLAYTLLALLINIFQCVPAVTSFDYIAIGKRGAPPTCIGVSEMNTILRAINITMDFCLLGVPIMVVSGLQMTRRKRMRIAALFAFGAIACIGSVMALIAKFALKTDPLWNYTSLLSWTLVELVFGVITASLPTLSVLLPKRSESSAAYSASTATRAAGTLRSRHKSGFPDSPSPPREDSYEDDQGIVRHDEFELASAANSMLDGGEGIDERKSAVAVSSGYSAQSRGQSPNQYGPLEEGTRSSS